MSHHNLTKHEIREEIIKVELHYDIYSYTFYKFVNSDDTIEIRELFFKSVMSFGIQMSLIGLVFINTKGTVYYGSF
jgi:hypothetical protein